MFIFFHGAFHDGSLGRFSLLIASLYGSFKYYLQFQSSELSEAMGLFDLVVNTEDGAPLGLHRAARRAGGPACGHRAAARDDHQPLGSGGDGRSAVDFMGISWGFQLISTEFLW